MPYKSRVGAVQEPVAALLFVASCKLMIHSIALLENVEFHVTKDDGTFNLRTERGWKIFGKFSTYDLCQKCERLRKCGSLIVQVCVLGRL